MMCKRKTGGAVQCSSRIGLDSRIQELVHLRPLKLHLAILFHFLQQDRENFDRRVKFEAVRTLPALQSSDPGTWL